MIDRYPPRPVRGGVLGGRYHLHLAYSVEWAQVVKLDGARLLAHVTDGPDGPSVRCCSRHLGPLVVSSEVRAALRRLPPAMYDGELVGRGADQRLYLIDLASEDCSTWDGRQHQLRRSTGGVILLAPTVLGAGGARDALSGGAEGVVMRRRNGRYRWARSARATDPEWIKFKPGL